jgi:signal transduction histidine kinase
VVRDRSSAVPDDLPLDQPQGALGARAETRDAWRRWFWLWEAYFAVGYVAMVVLLLLGDDANATGRAVSIGALTAMVLWYVGFGRSAIVDRDGCSPWRGRIFMLGMVVLLAVGVVFASSTSFALFAVCPLAFMSLDLREAILVIVPANLLPVLSSLVEDGFQTMLYGFLPGTLLTITFAVMLGTWISRIVSQSAERAELIKELEASREEVGRLSREAGMAAERTRLAAEIHDTLAQGFTSLVTLMQAAESTLDSDREKTRRHLRLAARTARENLGEARALVAGLMPSALGTGSLDEAIRRQLERLAEETPITATYRVEGESTALPTALEVVLLRAVQESLTNVRKHSGASTVSICLRVNGSAATLRVADDGTGFDTTRPSDGYGLLGMRSRATQVGGSVSVHSGASGTTVELEVPR